MESVLLLLAVTALLLVPGVAASQLIYEPDGVGIVTRCAAIFGLGFAVAAGCAFVLAVAHLFWLVTYLPLWLACSAVLWTYALRRGGFRELFGAIRTELADNRVPLLLGALILLVMLAIRATFLHVLPGPHYVYYLNGIEIAHDHGIPSRVPEYGSAWPPATDKVLLDSFTGLLTLLGNNPVVGPGVLLWLAFAGAAVGLWAAAWELGLRWTAILLPVLILADRRIPGLNGFGITAGFDFYRAENFGMALAFCALALAVVAIRDGGRRRALGAAVVLAAASGSHLVPTVVVVLMLAAIVLAELVRRGGRRPRTDTLRNVAMLAVPSALLGLLIRLGAGGMFGLGGASDPASYAKITAQLGVDPTLYLFNGDQADPLPHDGHFFQGPGVAIRNVIQLATGLAPDRGIAVLVLVAAIAVAAISIVWIPRLAALACAGAALLIGICVLSLAFIYHYNLYVEATFGLRRLTIYGPIGVCMLVLALLEPVLVWLGARLVWLDARLMSPGARLVSPGARHPAGSPTGGRSRLSQRFVWLPGAAATIVVCVLILPSSEILEQARHLDQGQVEFADWVRTKTPCGARLLLNERSEGAVAALTGRFALDEGMGAFLLPGRIESVVRMLETASDFYVHPWQYESFLREYNINYVVRANLPWLLGYGGPVRIGLDSKLDHTAFLKLVDATPYFNIYHVTGSRIMPVSPLLRGPYISCRRTVAKF